MQKRFTAKFNGVGMDNNEIIEQILENRGIDDLKSFLRPTEDDLVPFDKLENLHQAYEIIDNAVVSNQKFLVLADVDADGCCSNAIITRYLRGCGVDVRCVINQGKKHGAEDFDLSLLTDVDVMIIVDSLNNDPAVYERLLSAGIKLVVFDHHLPEQRLFDAGLDFTLVSSARNYPNKHLSGAGVCFKFVQYCDYMNLTSFADNLWVYAAIGIIADMSDMSVPENRYIAYRGLTQFNNPLVQKMIGNYMFDSQSVSFSIAPLINAAMRMFQNDLAMNVFLTDDVVEIDNIVKDLRRCREQQNKVVSEIIDDLLKQGEKQTERKCMFFMITGDIDAEVTGLIGNKLLQIYQRPLFVLKAKDNQYVGSMRSIGAGNFLELTNQTNLCLCQGHPEAGGAFIDKDNFEAFTKIIEDVLSNVEFSLDIEADVELETSQVNESLIKQFTALNKIGGAGCPPIKVLIRTNDYKVGTFSTKKHLKIVDRKTGMLLTKWNCMDWQTMDDEGEVVAVGVLSNPFYGRDKYLQLTIDEYVQQND